MHAMQPMWPLSTHVTSGHATPGGDKRTAAPSPAPHVQSPALPPFLPCCAQIVMRIRQLLPPDWLHTGCGTHPIVFFPPPPTLRSSCASNCPPTAPTLRSLCASARLSPASSVAPDTGPTRCEFVCGGVGPSCCGFVCGGLLAVPGVNLCARGRGGAEGLSPAIA